MTYPITSWEFDQLNTFYPSDWDMAMYPTTLPETQNSIVPVLNHTSPLSHKTSISSTTVEEANGIHSWQVQNKRRLENNAKERRRQQNREAQRLYRKRQAQELQELKDECRRLKAENEMLQNQSVCTKCMDQKQLPMTPPTGMTASPYSTPFRDSASPVVRPPLKFRQSWDQNEVWYG